MKKILIVLSVLLLLFAFGCLKEQLPQPNQTIQQNNTNQAVQQNQTGIFMLPGFKNFNVNETGFCGNMVCSSSETKASCCADCGCASGLKCWNNSCIAPSAYEQLSKTGYAIVISEGGNFSAPMMTVTMPEISENFIVWHQFFNGSPHIMAYSLASGKVVQLTNKSSQLEPSASGSRIVWLDQQYPNEETGIGMYQPKMDIYYYDAKEGIEGYITSRKTGKTAPQIDNDHVVWAEMVNGSKEIIFFDLKTGMETQLTHGAYIPSTYYISGNYAVWGGSSCNISKNECKAGYGLYNINTGKTEDFNELKGLDMYCYDFENGNITYAEWESEVFVNTPVISQIVLYDVESKTKKMLTDSESRKDCPRISGGQIIWSDNRNNGSLYSYSLATQEERNLVDFSPAGYYLYDIFGDKIVYIDVFNTTGLNLLVSEE